MYASSAPSQQAQWPHPMRLITRSPPCLSLLSYNSQFALTMCSQVLRIAGSSYYHLPCSVVVVSNTRLHAIRVSASDGFPAALQEDGGVLIFEQEPRLISSSCAQCLTMLLYV